MVGVLDRIFRRGGIKGRRSLDAGAGGRRWEGTPALPNLNSAMEAAGASIRQRAAYFARNNAYARRAVNIAVANAVGTGIKPQSRVKTEGARDALHTAFGLWSDQADATGRTDFYGLQSLLFRQLMEAGEGFVRFRWAGPAGPPDRPLAGYRTGPGGPDHEPRPGRRSPHPGGRGAGPRRAPHRLPRPASPAGGHAGRLLDARARPGL